MDFVFTWTIKNYSPMLNNNNTSIWSPKFSPDSLSAITWSLFLKGNFSPEALNLSDKYVSCYLCRREGGGTCKQTIDFTLELLSDEKEIINSVSFKNCTFVAQQYFLACDAFINCFHFLMHGYKNAIVRCHLKSNDFRSWGRKHCNVETEICVDEQYFSWIIHYENSPHWSQCRIFSLSKYSLIKARVRSVDGKLFFEISRVKDSAFKSQYISCSSTWLDLNRKVHMENHFSYYTTNLLPSAKEIPEWAMNVLVNNIVEPSTNRFILLLKFSISNGIIKSDQLNEDNHTFLHYSTPDIYAYLNIQFFSKAFTEMDGKGFNKNNCDVIFRVADKEYRAHTDILSIREHDWTLRYCCLLQEYFDQIIDISDVESDIFELYLMYLYRGQLNDSVTWENKFKLFILAKKFKTRKLSSFCHRCLTNDMTTHNIFQMLIIAMENKCYRMLPAIYNFINNFKDILFESIEWKELVKNHKEVANEMLNNLRKINFRR